MSLNDLQSALQQQADQHQNVVTITASVIVGASLTPRDGFDGLVDNFLRIQGGLSVTISAKIPAPTDDTLSFDGKVSLLGLSNADASIALVNEGGTGPVDLLLTLSLGDGWTFSRSFKSVDGAPFDSFAMNDAWYTFTTAPTGSFTWRKESIGIVQGLNFISTLALGGPFEMIGSLVKGLLPTTVVDFGGTIDPSTIGADGLGLPKMKMLASIDGSVNPIPSYFPLSDPRIGLTTGKDSSGNDTLQLSFIAAVTISGTVYGDLRTTLLPGSTTFSFWFIPSQPITPEIIIKLMAGEDFTKAIPSELSAIFKSVGLTGLGVSIDVKTLKVVWIGAAIGSTGPWQMGQFTMEQVTLRYTLLDPFGTRKSSFNFSATSTIFPDVFKGTFDVQITYSPSSKALGVGAGFTGSVSLNDLFKGLSGGSIDISSLGFDITFEDFSMAFSKNGNTYDYTLNGTAKVSFEMEVLGGKPTATFSAFVDSSTKSYKLTGGLLIGQSSFSAEADLGATNKVLKASWNALEGHYLGIKSIISAFGFTPPDFPDGLDLNLTSASISYDLVKKILTLEADSKNYGKAVFVGRKNPAGGWQFFFGIAVNQTIELTNMPLIKSVISDEETVEIRNIQVVIASGTLDKTAAGEINQSIDSGYPKVPTDGINAGVGLSMLFVAGSFQAPLTLSTGGSSSQGGGGNGGAFSLLAGSGSDMGGVSVPSSEGSDGTMWYDLQKTFGPVTFQKVGIRYKGSVLYVLMNASLSAGGLTIAVLGLGVGSPLTTFDPKFTIDGLAISFVEGPLDISGGLVGTIDPLNFYGELTLGFKELTIAALGAYAEVEGHPSFFLYAVLDYPIGGPSFFFVTGLAAGFGFNRRLLIPDITGVATFPLVQWAMGTGNPPGMNPGGDIGAQVTKVLTTLSSSGVVAPSLGDDWLALGIRFTSFELLDSFALLTVKFGSQFEIDLLGLSRLVLPPAPATPVAKAELALKASFSPDAGLLSVEGQLTPQSYVLSPDCHLTGGFAFYSWFGGPHEGEFVVTLGGYSPKFTPQPYYPKVPRLGLNWQVTSELTIKGELYFALTSSAVMAGGGLSAVWKSGGISAWFDVQADFLMVFTPFHYYISASIQLGASFRINLLFTHVTITIHLGVGLEIWGPEFTGKATIDLSIISFTIHFGASGQDTQTKVEWPDFVKQLMPKEGSGSSVNRMGVGRRAMRAMLGAAPADDAPPAVVQIVVSGGLLKTLSDKDGELNYIVSGEKFAMTTQTAIPAKTYQFSGHLTLAPDSQQPQRKGQVIQPNTDFGIGPTGTDSAGFTSTHSITIDSTEDSQFLAVRVLRNVPKSLWQKKDFDSHGVPQGVDPLNDTTIGDAVVGYTLVPYVAPPDHTLPIQIDNLKYTIDPNIQHFTWSDPYYPTTDSFAGETVPATIDASPATSNRPKLIDAMIAAGLPVSATVDVGDLANPSTNYLLAPPVLRYLGEQKSTGTSR